MPHIEDSTGEEEEASASDFDGSVTSRTLERFSGMEEEEFQE